MYYVRPNHAHCVIEDGFNKLELTIAIDPDTADRDPSAPKHDYGNTAWHMLHALMRELTDGLFANVTSPTKVDKKYRNSYDIPQIHNKIPVKLSAVVVLNSLHEPSDLDRLVTDALHRAFSRAIVVIDDHLVVS